MSALDPTGPSQPPVDAAYETSGNPATKAPAEEQAAASHAESSTTERQVDRRIPSEQSTSVDQATPNAMGRGVRGAGPGEEAQGKTDEEVGRHKELDGQQMAMPGEGRVSEAVAEKQGASGGQEDFASELDRKKAEQAPAREAMKKERQQKVDVAGVLGQTGGPANPVGKDNYPNTGS